MKRVLRAAIVLAAALPCFADSLPNPGLPSPYGVFYDFSLNNGSMGLDVRSIVPNYLQPGTYNLMSDILAYNQNGPSTLQLVGYSLTVGASDPLYTPTITVEDNQGNMTTYSYAFTDGVESHIGAVSSGMGQGTREGTYYQFDYSVAPEPASLFLLALGLPALLLLAKRRRRSQA